jgi:hypothetical protein
MTDIPDFLKLDRNLKKSIKIKQAADAIQEQIKALPNLQEFKLSQELTSFLCSIIENLFKDKKKYNVDKKQIVTDILKNIFGLNTNETEIIGKQIEFIHANNLIQQISSYQKFGRYTWLWFKKKIL